MVSTSKIIYHLKKLNSSLDAFTKILRNTSVPDNKGFLNVPKSHVGRYPCNISILHMIFLTPGSESTFEY